MTQTATKKVTISLSQDLLGFADAMAIELKTTRSTVISESLRAMRRREQDDLAREGYRFYAQEAEEFAEMSVQAIAEVLPSPSMRSNFRQLACRSRRLGVGREIR